MVARSGDAPSPGDSVSALPWPAAPVAVYVTLTRSAETRACVGRPASSESSLGGTVVALATDALTTDRRHPPVRADELDGLRLVIAFTDEGEPIADPFTVDPGRDGLLVSSPRGDVAFLPGEARTVRWALREARRIGIVRAGSLDVTYRRLTVVTLSEAPALPAQPVQEESADAHH
jgi:AMMECR1 domain-containing protein